MNYSLLISFYFWSPHKLITSFFIFLNRTLEFIEENKYFILYEQNSCDLFDGIQ